MSDSTKDTSRKSTKQTTTARKPATAGTTTATKTPARRATKAKTTTTLETRTPSYDEIATRARTLFERSGHAAGRDEEFWLEAERQLRDELAR